jgi:thiamine-monophosphate kinase
MPMRVGEMGDHPPCTIRLGPGAEFDRIRTLIARGGELPAAVRVGPGDDAAVIEGGWVLSSDICVEDVHFRRSWLSDREIGYRATAAAFSDLAAMAATPLGLLVSIAVPESGEVDLDELQVGVSEAAQACGGAILGGDLSRSPGPLVLDVVVVGRTSWPVLRNGAEAGDEIWVTGRLGASTAAVHAWRQGREPSPEARAAFSRPTPRIVEACCLVEQECVDALMDLSDGLAGDVGHMAAASGVKVVLDAGAIPIAESALVALGAEGALEAALHGGEDYELLFVTDPGVVDVAYFEGRFGIDVTCVGHVLEGEGVWIDLGDGAPQPLERAGFDHFGGAHDVGSSDRSEGRDHSGSSYDSGSTDS